MQQVKVFLVLMIMQQAQEHPQVVLDVLSEEEMCAESYDVLSCSGPFKPCSAM